MFLSASVRAAMMQAAADPDSAVADLIGNCQAAVDNPSSVNGSGYQGFDWAALVSACGLAWQLTGDARYATAGVRIWRALLEDIDTVGDKRACVAGAPEATAIASIRRDSGYAIRMIGPHTALAYDWLHDAPGVTDAFRQQSRDCFRHWLTYYGREGYLNHQPGANYHAGFVAAKTLIAVAEGGEDGANSDRFWTEAVDDIFGKQIIASGLAQDNAGVPRGAYHGVLVGGDWPEGWQYGPLSVTEYAYSARALVEQGVDLAPLSAWGSDLTLREIYSLLPDRSGKYVGGDFEAESYFSDPATGPFDATRVGPSSDQAAGWATFMIRALDAGSRGGDLWRAVAEARAAAPVDPLQAPLPPWYLARGTRNLYARSSWAPDAFWAVFTSAPRLVPDHQHMDASNFVFTRGGDGLVVDPSPYGTRSSLTSNAMTLESNVVIGEYVPSQTPWSEADLPYARGTASGVVAARGDFAKAFNFSQDDSDIRLARRDWVFLPEGEIVTIDRATTPGATKKALLRFRTPGTLAAASASPFVARAPSGASALAIHAVKLVPATAPVMRDIPSNEDCGSATFGACRSARIKVGEYAWEVNGPDVLAVHVLDGLGEAEPPADVAPIDAAPIDVDPPQNAGVVGASIYRAQKQTFVVEPATLPAPASLGYGVPGANPSRHVVFDAPADAQGRTAVTAVAQGDRCVVTLAAGEGLTGAPAIFTLAPAAAGCTVSADADVPPGSVSPGSGGFDRPGGAGGDGVSAGCGCGVSGAQAAGGGGGWTSPVVSIGTLLALVLAGTIRRRTRMKSHARRPPSVAPLTLVLLLAVNLGGGCKGLIGDHGSSGGSTGNGGSGGSNGPGPTITSFTAQPGSLPEGGGPVTLTWSVNGADQIVIDQGIGAVTGTSTQTTVTATTIFTLSATNRQGTNTRSAIVTVGASATGPVILSFSASPASLSAPGPTTLRWQVLNADSLSIDHGVGAVTGDSTSVSPSATTIYTLTATNADGSSHATTAVVIGQNPSSRGGRSVKMVAPVNGESFLAPSSLRLVATAFDPNISPNDPMVGRGGNASKVQFLVDDAVVLEVDGTNAEYWVFKGFVSGVVAGQHRVSARAIYKNPDDVLDSQPMLIDVADPPAYGRTVDLDADLVLSGSAAYELAGTATGRVRLNGNGHRITSGSSYSGVFTMKFVDVFDVGQRADTSQTGVNVTTTGTVTVEDCIFDSSNTVQVSLGGSATASVRRNLFRSNMRQPIGQLPDSATADGLTPSFPAVVFAGTSTGTKAFAGNNVGAGWVEFNNVKGWVVGGDTDVDSNVLIGPRVGIHPSGDVQVRRNFSHHIYNGGWSQGNNFELGDGPSVIVEHNVIYGSSWPVRGTGGDFRYNLVLEAGHQWLWATKNGASAHHNIFVGGDADIGGLYVLYSPTNVKLYNNTIDGLSDIGQAVLIDNGSVSLTSNLFLNVPAPAVKIQGGSLTADYNLFPAGGYSDGRTPANDKTGNAMLTNPATSVFVLDEVGVWKRSVTVRDVLTQYRMRYTPKAGSPAIDAGDPAGGAGNDIGAVGAGDVNAADRFGRF